MKINKTKKSERLYYIDLLETIAISLVLFYHLSNYNYNFINDNNSIRLYFRYFLRTILSCGVPIFFVVNGYLLLNRKLNLKKHILKIIKIILLTLLWGIIDLLLLMNIRNEPLTFIDFIKGLWSLKQGWINYLWYMQALVVIYLIFPLIKITYDKRKVFFYISKLLQVFLHLATLL